MAPPRPADSIINPEAPLALRLSGQLLLGLVRLYLRRLQFLEEDAGLALRGLARVRRAAAAGLPCRLRHLAGQAAGHPFFAARPHRQPPVMTRL